MELKEAKQHGKSTLEGNVVRQSIDRTNDTKQRRIVPKFEKWEQDDLILNLTTDCEMCAYCSGTMIRYAEEADEEYGRRLRENLKIRRNLDPWQS